MGLILGLVPAKPGVRIALTVQSINQSVFIQEVPGGVADIPSWAQVGGLELLALMENLESQF